MPKFKKQFIIHADSWLIGSLIPAKKDNLALYSVLKDKVTEGSVKLQVAPVTKNELSNHKNKEFEKLLICTELNIGVHTSPHKLLSEEIYDAGWVPKKEVPLVWHIDPNFRCIYLMEKEILVKLEDMYRKSDIILESTATQLPTALLDLLKDWIGEDVVNSNLPNAVLQHLIESMSRHGKFELHGTSEDIALVAPVFLPILENLNYGLSNFAMTKVATSLSKLDNTSALSRPNNGILEKGQRELKGLGFKQLAPHQRASKLAILILDNLGYKHDNPPKRMDESTPGLFAMCSFIISKNHRKLKTNQANDAVQLVHYPSVDLYTLDSPNYNSLRTIFKEIGFNSEKLATGHDLLNKITELLD